MPLYSCVPARTLRLGQQTNPAMPSIPAWPNKAPGEVLDYKIDAYALLDPTDDEILRCTVPYVTGPDVALQVLQSRNTADKVEYRLSGGTPGGTYLVSVQLQLASGQVPQIDCQITIGAGPLPPPPPGAPVAVVGADGKPVPLPDGSTLVLGGPPPSGPLPVLGPDGKPYPLPDGSTLVLGGTAQNPAIGVHGPDGKPIPLPDGSTLTLG